MIEMKVFPSREEWLKARKSCIGGSDAGAVMGMNAYKSNVTLWQEKTGRKPKDNLSDNEAVQYGNNAEDLLRKLFELDFPNFKVEYQPHNMWLNSDYTFAHASLDGWLTDENGAKGILEIKTAAINGAAQALKWKDQIPDSYFCQLLHYLMVTDFEFAILKAQLKYSINGDISLSTRHYRIDRADYEEDIAILAESERRFAEAVAKDEEPPLVLDII